jgi:hypothetical protein
MRLSTNPLRSSLGRLALATSLAAQAQQPKVLCIAMAASDVPTTSGMPNNGSDAAAGRALLAEPGALQWLGADALNISLVSSDASQMARWFLSSNAGHWRDEAFDAAFTEVETGRARPASRPRCSGRMSGSWMARPGSISCMISIPAR